MNADREQHLAKLLTFFQGHFTLKYHEGVAKYPNESLENKDLADLLYEALDENLDQFAYIATAILKLPKSKRPLQKRRLRA